jgi:hypothetical protein
MKVVINTCYGGFSLSPKATKRLAELNGKECYFFLSRDDEYKPIKMEDIDDGFWTVFTVPDPNKVIGKHKEWHKLTSEQQIELNKRYDKISLDNRPDDRADPKLVQVVEELGEEANGACAKLKVVKIPNGVKYEISEYYGIETIEEVHRSWS